ncbi:MAG: trypsin-like peptidase domain-containing protein [Acidobacteria bacterium]|nr:trypsin-like peptidase domain-containing protein [Acidobacteriota bacterium]
MTSQEKQEPEFNTLLIQSTFRIDGPDGKFGTAFIVGRPFSSDDPKKVSLVMVTAAHVLEEIQGEFAVLSMRRKLGSGRWDRQAVSIKIREASRPLWTRHPDADVAAMYITVPDGLIETVITTDVFADDQILTRFEVHPGDELLCLGYPLGAEANPAGFPILRSGKISSFPILPTRETKSLLYDFRIFPGNSGGPVYLVGENRIYGGSTNIGKVHFLVGLISKEKLLVQETSQLYEKRQQMYSLGLAEVIHASLIKETIYLLPQPTDTSQTKQPQL